jgi:hypothetical protein
MTARKEQTTEWSSRDKIVWGKPQTYNKLKQICPRFQYGTSPWKEGEYFIGQYAGEKTYNVFRHISGYTSLTGGHVPSQTEGVLYGKTLKECKAYLSDLIQKLYKDQELQKKNVYPQSDI